MVEDRWKSTIVHVCYFFATYMCDKAVLRPLPTTEFVREQAAKDSRQEEFKVPFPLYSPLRPI